MIRYRLDELGWYQFEWLCQSLLKANLGIAIEAWGGSSDLGRDAYWKRALSLKSAGVETPGPFVFQAKFVSGANAAGAIPDGAILTSVKKECRAITKRALSSSYEKPSTYVLMTNAPLSATLKEKITSCLKESLPQCQILLWESNDMCALLDNAPNIRVAFPQLLGLRDLSELIKSAVNSPIIERSSLGIEQAIELANVFVPTDSYNKSLQILDSHGFVVLTGPPEMGKTAIARMIGLAKLGENWECYECHRPEDIFKISRNETGQVFIVDDAFGSTEYRPEIAQEWAQDMDKLLRTVGKKRWLIWTSRPAMLNAALKRMHLQGCAENFPKPGDVLVDAKTLSTNEKALILYRHAKAAHLDESAKLLISKHAKEILKNPHFTPERVRRFIEKTLPRIDPTIEDHKILELIAHEITRATESMGKSFDALDLKHKEVLVAMLDAGRGTINRQQVESACNRLSSQTENIDQLIFELSAHFLRVNAIVPKSIFDSTPPEETIEWMHPSWRDLVIEYISKNSEIRKEFLSKCGVEGILLAISSAGGSEGQRQSPFLICQEDVSDVARSASNIIEHDESVHTSWILFSIFEVVSKIHRAETTPPLGQEILKLTEEILLACRKRWDKTEETVFSSQISAYYKISEYISPLPPSPNLQNIWNNAWDIALSEIENFDDVDAKPNIDGFAEWVELLLIIRQNEPRFLRQFRFLKIEENRIREFFADIATRIERDIDFDNEDECDEEEENIEYFSYLLVSCKKAMPSMNDLIIKIESEISLANDRIESARAHLEELKTNEREEEQYLQERQYEERGREEKHIGAASRPTETLLSYNSYSDFHMLPAPIDVPALFDDL